MKTKVEKSPAKQRASIRANEQRRLQYAMETIRSLLRAHDMDTPGNMYDLQMMEAKLGHAIKFQHCHDPYYVEQKRIEAGIPTTGTF